MLILICCAVRGLKAARIRRPRNETRPTRRRRSRRSILRRRIQLGSRMRGAEKQDDDLYSCTKIEVHSCNGTGLRAKMKSPLNCQRASEPAGEKADGLLLGILASLGFFFVFFVGSVIRQHGWKMCSSSVAARCTSQRIRGALQGTSRTDAPRLQPHPSSSCPSESAPSASHFPTPSNTIHQHKLNRTSSRRTPS